MANGPADRPADPALPGDDAVLVRTDELARVERRVRRYCNVALALAICSAVPVLCVGHLAFRMWTFGSGDKRVRTVQCERLELVSRGRVVGSFGATSDGRCYLQLCAPDGGEGHVLLEARGNHAAMFLCPETQRSVLVLSAQEDAGVAVSDGSDELQLTAHGIECGEVAPRRFRRWRRAAPAGAADSGDAGPTSAVTPVSADSDHRAQDRPPAP